MDGAAPEWTGQIEQAIGGGSAVIAALEKLDSRDQPLLSPLADYIEQNPEQRGKTVETLIQNGAGARDLVPERLEALEKLTEHLGAGSARAGAILAIGEELWHLL